MTQPRRSASSQAATTASAGTPVAASSTDRPGRFAAYAVLRERNFRYLFLSTATTGFAQWGQTLGLSWIVYDLTDRNIATLGAVNAVGGFVRLFCGPFVGVALDRWHRRTILIWSTLTSAVEAIILTILVVSGLVEVWHLFVFAAAEAIVSTTNQNARQAFVYDITGPDTLPDAVAVNAMVQNITRITGPTLIGALIGLWGSAMPFITIGVMMLLGVAATIPITKRTRQGPRASGNPLRNLRDGFVYVANDRRLLGITVVMASTALLVYPYLAFLTVFARDVLNRGAGALGILSAAAGIGSLLGVLGLAAFRRVEHRAVAMIVGLLLYFACLMGFSQSTNLWLSAALLAIGGAPHIVAQTQLQILQQLLPVNEMRGRVTGVIQTAFALYPLGALPLGLAIAKWGAPNATFVSFSAASILLIVLLVAWKPLRTV